MGEAKVRVRVARITREAEGINAYELVAAGGGALPAFEAGAHLEVSLPGGLVRSYSLCNDPAETHRYVLGVQREAAGRGGSRALHDTLREGDVLEVSPPRNQFPLVPGAGAVLLIAGGIGITPLLSMARQLQREGRFFTLHYCTRSAERTAFRAALAAPELASHVHLHHDGGDPSRGLDLAALLACHPPDAHLYCCGPLGLMAAVQQAAAHWPAGTVHFESFGGALPAAGCPNRPFEVLIRSSGRRFRVPADKSLLHCLREQGHAIPSDCEAGSCGTCYTALFDGEADHRDSYLSESERQVHMSILPCVSRAKGEQLVLDL